jgi:hypothetical protein
VLADQVQHDGILTVTGRSDKPGGKPVMAVRCPGMRRVAVVIGVSRTGGLPQLQAVESCVTDMVEWAEDQGFDAVRTLADTHGSAVTISQIQQEIGTSLATGTVDQLVVYFAGHGVNVGQAEFWLLSRAPEWPNEAVNVEASKRFAAQSGVAHVVLVSDACRTAAAADLVYQSVQGASIFPNRPATTRKTFVDCFYACAVGSPALEIRASPALPFRAVYTETLTEALRGEVDTVIETARENDRDLGFVRPARLGDYLADEVGRRLFALDPSGDRIQRPDVEIRSRDGSFVARFDPPPGGRRDPGRVPEPAAPALTAVARDAVHRQLRDGGDAATDAIGRQAGAGGEWLLSQTELVGSPFGPDRFETGCGLKVRGAQVTSAYARDGRPDLADGSWVRVDPGPTTAAVNVALEFDNDSCTIVPALPGFIAALTFQGRELIDLAYEPATNSGRYADYAHWMDDYRAIRGVISAANRIGGFRPDEPELEALARRMQFLKSGDPTMALYAAYAYADLGLTDRLAQMSDYLGNDLQVTLFDLDMLAGERRSAPRPWPVAPMMPLLARGWALLDAYDVVVPDPAMHLRRTHLVPSTWTLFDGAGMDLAVRCVAQGDL